MAFSTEKIRRTGAAVLGRFEFGGQDVPVVEAELPRYDLEALGVGQVGLLESAEFGPQGLGHGLGVTEIAHDVVLRKARS